jgi:hypothetical protein
LIAQIKYPASQSKKNDFPLVRDLSHSLCVKGKTVSSKLVAIGLCVGRIAYQRRANNVNSAKQNILLQGVIFMPRGIKNSVKPIPEQIAEIDSKIQSHQAKIAKLNAKKKKLITSKEKIEMDTLYQLVKQSGQTPAELFSKLSQ